MGPAVEIVESLAVTMSPAEAKAITTIDRMSEGQNLAMTHIHIRMLPGCIVTLSRSGGDHVLEV
jgi:hypothetical protein